jgi:TadE-like protein
MWRSSRRGMAVRRLNLRRSEGQAMAEFALVAPVFLLFIAGLLAFGRIFFYWIDSNHLANETARWAAVDQNPYSTTLQQHVLDSGTLEFQDASVCINFEDSTPAIGEYLTVKVQKPVYTLTRLLPFSKITIKATSTMRIENLGNGTAPVSYKAAPVDGVDNIKTCT